MKTLLAIINEPKESQDFIQYVAEMATGLTANVNLLYTLDPNDYPLGTPGSQGAAVARVQQNLVAQAETAKKTIAEHINNVKEKINGEVSINLSSELGVRTQIVSDFISERKADMVVLEGQKNESFWTQSSDNMDIISIVNSPVWIIPKEWHYKPFTKIVYATDYKEEDVTGLQRLIAITRHYSPDINVLHITDSVDFEEKIKKAGFLDILQKQVAYKQLTLKAMTDDKQSDITELLDSYVKLVKANLIVVVKENRTFFEKFFKSDPARKIIKNASLPVLVFHKKE